MDSALLAAKRTPFGDPLFFPPGQHPALHRERQMLETLEALDRQAAVKEAEFGVSLPARRDLTKALEFHRDRVTSFEEAESIRKHDFLRRMAPR